MEFYRFVVRWLDKLRCIVASLGVPISAIVAAAALAFNVWVEHSRWGAHLSALYMGQQQMLSTVPVSPTPFLFEVEPVATEPLVKDRSHYKVFLRNESHRPTAILGVTPLDISKSAVHPHNYRHKLGPPLVIPAWGLVKLRVYVDEPDQPRIAWLVFRDMDDELTCVRVNVDSTKSNWNFAGCDAGSP